MVTKKCVILSALFVLIFGAPLLPAATTIKGTVVDVQGSKVKIEYNGEYAPNAGDPVEIGFEIGEDFAPVEGEWKIVEAGPDFAWAQAEGADAGTPALDYIAIISSQNPRERSGLTRSKEKGRKASDVIPVLNAKVAGLRFYESGPDILPLNERVYKGTFATSTTRYINWELTLQHPQPNQRIDFRAAAIYYRPDGSIMTEHGINTYLESNWIDSFHTSGWGWPEPGNWKTGEYAVEIFVNDQKVANGSFSVY